MGTGFALGLMMLGFSAILGLVPGLFVGAIVGFIFGWPWGVGVIILSPFLGIAWLFFVTWRDERKRKKQSEKEKN